jgi:DNA-binding NtrC family response regulator
MEKEMNEKMKVLVVDDNKEFSQNVKDILELKGYEVQTAIDGFKALDIVKQEVFNVVLMDIKMPVMNGVETFKKMKEIVPSTPVIMVTAFSVEELIRKSLRNGAFACLRKPLDFDRLFSTLERAIVNGSLILVVDDNENLCENIKDVLSQKGYRVDSVLDGNAAIRKVEENNFEIMLLDMKLPPLNGLETFLKIRDIRPGVAVIIITGHMMEMSDMVETVLQKSAYTCLEKPINMDQLILLLEKIEGGKAREDLNVR